MPELPEVETIRRELESKILDKKILSVEVRLPKMVSIGPETVSNKRKSSKEVADKFGRILRGQKFTSARRRAKMLILDLSGAYSLLVHLKMSGQFIFASKKELPKKIRAFNNPKFPELKLPHKYTHVIFHFQNGDKLYYNDLRQFGYLRLVRETQISKVREFREYGPEPFDPVFSPDYFSDRLKTRKVSIKQVLMDPRVVTGIGNIYSDEILYCARVRPYRAANKVKPRELGAIYKCIPKILKSAIKRQGSSVGDFFRTDGREGTFGKVHKVYAKVGRKCQKCGTIIKSIKLGGRTSSYCPSCQK